jgi:hypothetical protein
MAKQHVCHKFLFKVKQRLAQIQARIRDANCKKLRRGSKIYDYYLEYKVSLGC